MIYVRHDGAVVPSEFDGLKHCYACDRWLPRSERVFKKDRTRTDGLSYVCRECHARQGKARRARNPEKQREYDRLRSARLRAQKRAREEEIARQLECPCGCGARLTLTDVQRRLLGLVDPVVVEIRQKAGRLGAHRRWHGGKPSADCDYCAADVRAAA